MKALLRQLTPPLLWNAVRQWRTGSKDLPAIEFSGDYRSWTEACAVSRGYDDPSHLARARTAAIAVRDGVALAERDGVPLPKPEPPLAVAAALLRAATEQDGRLHVVDFGGALGTTYRSLRQFLAPVRELRWRVVDLPAVVACGQKEFQTAELEFHPDLDSATAPSGTSVLLLSGSLQFLPAPREFLRAALSRPFSYIVLDRTFVWHGGRDRLTVQQVPAWIGAASYPAWFFDERTLREEFSAHDLLTDYPALDEPRLPDAYAAARGYVIRRKTNG